MFSKFARKTGGRFIDIGKELLYNRYNNYNMLLGVKGLKCGVCTAVRRSQSLGLLSHIILE